MVICPIARAVHCTGCLLVKFCPAKTLLGDFDKDAAKFSRPSENDKSKSEKKQDDSSADK